MIDHVKLIAATDRADPEDRAADVGQAAAALALRLQPQQRLISTLIVKLKDDSVPPFSLTLPTGLELGHSPIENITFGKLYTGSLPLSQTLSSQKDFFTVSIQPADFEAIKNNIEDIVLVFKYTLS